MNQVAPPPLSTDIQTLVQGVLAQFPSIGLAVLFGSMASGRARSDSDLDLAVAGQHPLTMAKKMALMQALAKKTGRPIDLIDLATVSEPLLGQIVRHGKRVQGSDAEFAPWITRHLVEQADFVPYQNRVLEERQMAWIGMQLTKNWSRCGAACNAFKPSARPMRTYW